VIILIDMIIVFIVIIFNSYFLIPTNNVPHAAGRFLQYAEGLPHAAERLQG
jgi:hypothetical protein